MDPQNENKPSVHTSDVINTNNPINQLNTNTANNLSMKQPNNNNHITIISVAIFILLALGAVVFLYYQNQQLKKMLVNYQIPQVSPYPTNTNPIANWKTYTDSKEMFSFKYPPNWEKSKDVGLFNDSSGSFILDVQKTQTNLSLEEFMKSKCIESGTNFCSDAIVGSITGSIQYDRLLSHYNSIDTLIKQGNAIFDISLASRNPNQSADEVTKSTYNQILSTFKFLDASPSASPIGCTLEAKICPNGSSVGRTGPNCEFAPCP